MYVPLYTYVRAADTCFVLYDILSSFRIYFHFFIVSLRRKSVWGIERSGFFNGREKWAKGFENQRV